MSVSLLKISFRNLSNFKDGRATVDFVTEKRVFSEELDDGVVSQLFGRVYKLSTIAFAGINAAGKTTLLNLLSSLLKTYIGNDSLSYDMRIKAFFDSELEVESFFYEEETNLIYKLFSIIRKDPDAQTLTFKSERLYAKPATASTTSKNLFDFSGAQPDVDRDMVKSSFLKKEDSIFSIVMNKYDQSNNSVQDLCSITNHNWISTIALGLIVPFAQYLDPSIEYIHLETPPSAQPSRIVFEIKFKQQSQAIAVELRELDLYLSSGTIKGISCLSAISIALAQGGYVLIDEIENHLNKTIVITLIDLFTSNLNKGKATLLFSTHYSEILDCISRSDGIYLLDKTDSIQVKKFSLAAGDKDRKDKRKSDLVMSGTLTRTPSYPAYRQLVESMESFLAERGHE
ncbi:AAA family ATPase [Adlercreutzia muris]|uniref:ATP-binding protein n=1 Tax=Adlercreutzia muris TaxID=1796610 RepID=A0A7C8BPM1_9ACTN|nr:AAA family ATPase [Adlercreutzia muris]KAB1636620.1 ATP-binding protein [Adlercreutzia muris]MCR2027612.1 ATP-binding protein [Adlercreutzia muris]